MTSSVTTHMRIFLLRPRLIKLPLLSLPIQMLRHAGAAWDNAYDAVNTAYDDARRAHTPSWFV
jgi:hypothetical protein